MGDKSDKKEKTTVATAYLSNSCKSTQRAKEAADVLRAGQKEMENLVKNRANCGLEQNGGYAAEIWHKATFEADAVQKGGNNLDVIIGPRGGRFSKGSADLTVTENGKKVLEAGSKFRSKATETVFDHSNAHDMGRQKITPSDQLSQVRELSSKRAITGTLKAKDYGDTAKNATDKLSYKDINSKPLSKRDSTELVKNPGKLGQEAFKTEFSQAAKNGALVGGALEGGISLATNVRSCLKNEKEIDEAMACVAKDTATGAAKGAIVTAGTSIAKQGLIKAGAANLAKGSAPVAIATSVFEAGTNIAGDVVDYIDGKIDGGDVVCRAIEHTGKAAVKGGTSWAGAEMGAVVGSFLGPVGTFAGGLIGGMAGYFFGSSLFD